MIGFRSLYKRGWFLVTVAAVLRLTMVWVLMAHSPSWGVNEAAGIARQLVSGKGFASPFHDYAGPTAWLAPVYPVLLTGVFHIFGDGAISLWVAVLLNVVFGSLTTAVVLQLGRGFFGQTAGTLAAWMWAVSPPMIVMPWLPWETCFSALMFGFVFLRTLRLGENSPLWQWILCGALWSFAALLNPALLAPLPALAFRAVRKPQCRIGSAAMLMVCLRDHSVDATQSLCFPSIRSAAQQFLGRGIFWKCKFCAASHGSEHAVPARRRNRLRTRPTRPGHRARALAPQGVRAAHRQKDSGFLDATLLLPLLFDPDCDCRSVRTFARMLHWR